MSISCAKILLKSTTAVVKKEEVKNTPTAEKKGKVKAEKGKVEEAKVVEVQPKAEEQKPEAPKSLNMVYLYSELQAVKQIIQEHGQQIADIQEVLARKRKPVANGKIQIKDKKTSKIYPSKNNCYQSLLKSGELKDLVDKGVFGPTPEKNTFGWYMLVREIPDMLALIGDKVDSIPGIPGVEPKTAIRLLKIYGNLENVIQHLEELGDKPGTTIREHCEQALVAKRLASLRTDVPINVPFSTFAFQFPNKATVEPLLRELRFELLLKRLEETLSGAACK